MPALLFHVSDRQSDERCRFGKVTSSSSANHPPILPANIKAMSRKKQMAWNRRGQRPSRTKRCSLATHGLFRRPVYSLQRAARFLRQTFGQHSVPITNQFNDFLPTIYGTPHDGLQTHIMSHHHPPIHRTLHPQRQSSLSFR